MFLVLDFEHTYIKKWCYANSVECQSCEVSNQMFREEDELAKWLWHKYCKIKLFSGTTSHGASKGPKAYLEPSKTSVRKRFCSEKAPS